MAALAEQNALASTPKFVRTFAEEMASMVDPEQLRVFYWACSFLPSFFATKHRSFHALWVMCVCVCGVVPLQAPSPAVHAGLRPAVPVDWQVHRSEGEQDSERPGVLRKPPSAPLLFDVGRGHQVRGPFFFCRTTLSTFALMCLFFLLFALPLCPFPSSFPGSLDAQSPTLLFPAPSQWCQLCLGPGAPDAHCRISPRLARQRQGEPD